MVSIGLDLILLLLVCRDQLVPSFLGEVGCFCHRFSSLWRRRPSILHGRLSSLLLRSLIAGAFGRARRALQALTWTLPPLSSAAFWVGVHGQVGVQGQVGGLDFPVRGIRDLKIRRRRVSTTAAVSWGEWGEVAVVWREKLTLRSTVEEADGFITSFRGLSVF